jgi:predicted Zn-dependent protease
VDDGTHNGGPTRFVGDDEGNTSQRTVLIEDGILKATSGTQ